MYSLQKQVYDNAVARAVSEVERLGMLLHKDRKVVRDLLSTGMLVFERW
jgi:hypothetical protein